MELVGRQISLRVSKNFLNDLKFHQILSFRWYCKILTSKKSTDHQNAGFVSKLHSSKWSDHGFNYRMSESYL